MTRLQWGGDRPYEAGVARGVFYPKNGVGCAWNGLVTVNESTVDASQSLIYIDGEGHQNQLLIGSFAASIGAITYPEEFEPFDGYSETRPGQRRREFDFSYRTLQSDGHYKIHLIYNALATPTDRNNNTINVVIDVGLFTWDLSTRPEVIPGGKASAHFIIDTTLVNPGVVVAIEDRLYGSNVSQPDMPLVPEILAIFEEYAIFRVVDNGDGTAIISGPDEAVRITDVDAAEFIWSSVIFVGDDTYQLSSF